MTATYFFAIALATITALAIFPAIAIAVKKKRLYSLPVLLLGYYTVQVPLVNNETFFSSEYVWFGAIYVVVSNLVLSITVYLNERSQKSSFKIPSVTAFPSRQRSQFALISMCLLWAGMTLYRGETALQSVWEQRSSGSSFISPILNILPFAIAVCWAAVRSKALRAITFPIGILAVVNAGARVALMSFAGILLVFAFRRFSTRVLAIAFIPTTFAYFSLHSSLRLIRGVGIRPFLDGDYARIAAGSAEIYSDTTGGEGRIGEYFVLAVKAFFEDSQITQPLATLSRLILLPVPTSWVSFKPDEVVNSLWRYSIDVGYASGDNYYSALLDDYWGGRDGSLHPTLWGDGLLNLGAFGAIIWPLLWGTIFVRLESRFARSFPNENFMIVGAALLPAYSYIARGNVYLGVFLFASLLPLLVFLRPPIPKMQRKAFVQQRRY